MSAPKTVRVRIAVAVSTEGEYSAVGLNRRKPSGAWEDVPFDAELRRGLVGTFAATAASGAVVHCVEAILPLPESVTVEGEVAK